MPVERRGPVFVCLAWVLVTVIGCAADDVSRASQGQTVQALHACSSLSDDCDDGEICTLDVCNVQAGECVHQSIPGCCYSAGDCTKFLECVEPACTNNVCSYRSILGCVSEGGSQEGGGTDAGDGGGDAAPLDAGDDAGALDAGDDAASLDGGGDAAPLDAGDDAGALDAGGDAGALDDGGDAGALDAGGDANALDAGSDAGTLDAGDDAGGADAGGDAATVDGGSDGSVLDSGGDAAGPDGAVEDAAFDTGPMNGGGALDAGNQSDGGGDGDLVGGGLTDGAVVSDASPPSTGEDGGAAGPSDPDVEAGGGPEGGIDGAADAAGQQSPDARAPDVADGAPSSFSLRGVQGGACSAAPPAFTASQHWGWWGLTLCLVGGLCRRRLGVTRRRNARRGLGPLLLLALCVFVPGRARAEGFRLDRLHAPSLPEDLFWLERAPSPPDVEDGAFARLGFGFASDPLVAEDTSGGEVALVSEQVALSAAVGISAWQRLHVAAAFPFWLQRGAGLPQSAGDGSVGPLGSPALGDPSLEVRGSVLPAHSRARLAVAVTTTLPVGNSSALAADHAATVTPRALFSLPVGPHGGFVGANLGVGVRPPATLDDLQVGSELRWALGASVGASARVAATLEVAGSWTLMGNRGRRGAPVEVTAGMRYRAPAGLVLALGLGAGVSPGYGAPDARVLAALGYRFGLGALD